MHNQHEMGIILNIEKSMVVPESIISKIIRYSGVSGPLPTSFPPPPPKNEKLTVNAHVT